MIPYDAVAGYSALLGQVRSAAVSDLDRLAASLTGLSVAEQYDALSELLPDLGQRYEVAASKVTAEFFSELQQMQGVRKPVSPVELDPVSRASWQALAGWSTSGKTLAEQAANDVFFGLLSGGFTRRLTEAASDTMVENAAVQGGMRYQRVPAAGCCAFCAHVGVSRRVVYVAGVGYTSCWPWPVRRVPEAWWDEGNPSSWVAEVGADVPRQLSVFGCGGC
jgi:hypothetical protein